MRGHRIIILYILTIWSRLSSGQSEVFQKTNYTVSHGLPSQTVYNAIQDREGFLWVCTDAGVSRFDGNKFTNYNTNHGLGENEILDLYSDSRGRIWFLPFYGKISYWQSNKFYTSRNDSTLTDLAAQTGIRHMTEDRNKNLIFFSESDCHQIMIMDSMNKVSALSVPDWFDRSDCLIKMWLDKNQEANFVSRKGKILTLNGNSFQLAPRLNESIQYDRIILSADLKKAFALRNGGLLELTPDGCKTLLPEKSIAEPMLVQNANMDVYANIWITHSRYNNCVYLKSGDSYTKSYPILNKMQANVCFDQSDNAWLCSSLAGLTKIPLSGINQTNLFFNNHLLNENILSSHCQKDGTIWFGYSNGQVSRIKEGETKHIDLNRGTRIYNRVLDIGEDAAGKMYFILDEGGCRLTVHKDGSIAKEFYVDEAGNSGPGKGIFYLDQDLLLFGFSHKMGGFSEPSASLSQIANDLFRERRFSHFITRDGKLLMSTTRGLISIYKNKLERLSSDQEILDCRINKFAQHPNGDIILATHGKGLIMLRDQKLFQHIDVDDGFSGFICRNIYLHKDLIWLCTNGGITVVRYNNKHYEIVRNINTADGLISDDVNSLFIHQDKIYASTTKGLSVLELSPTAANPERKQKVILQSLSINGVDTFSKSTYLFPFDDYHFKINFITPNLSQDQQLLYRYKLLPNDQNWTLTRENSLEFAKLNAGDYLLSIQSKLKNSDWSEPLELSFHILPPFYRTWWFYSTLAVLLALLTFVGTHYILNRRYIQKLDQVRTNEAIQNERNRIAADLHDDIGADLTNLVILSRLFSKGQEKENPLASKIELVSHELISKMNEVIWALNPLNDKLEDLVAYVHYYARTVTDQHDMDLGFKTDLPMKSPILLSAEQRRNTFLVIKEFLNNTIKHSKSQTFGIRISIQNTTLQVELSDTGRGSPESLSSDFGNGISNMRRRIETCGGSFVFEKNEPQGLKLNFTLPLKKTS